MGRIKTTLVKRVSHDLVKEHRKELKKNFDDNKKAVDEIADIPSKKLRNVIAGYVTRLMKRSEDM